MLRTCFDVRTVQHWMGHKSLETTIPYVSPAKDVHDKLDQAQIGGGAGGRLRARGGEPGSFTVLGGEARYHWQHGMSSR